MRLDALPRLDGIEPLLRPLTQLTSLHLAKLPALQGSPYLFEALACLRSLHLSACPGLQTPAVLPATLTALYASSCSGLRSLDAVSRCSLLQTLEVANLSALTTLPCLPSSVRRVEIVGCSALAEIRGEWAQRELWLKLRACDKLQNLPDELLRGVSLRQLVLTALPLTALPAVPRWVGHLAVHECPALVAIPTPWGAHVEHFCVTDNAALAILPASLPRAIYVNITANAALTLLRAALPSAQYVTIAANAALTALPAALPAATEVILEDLPRVSELPGTWHPAPRRVVLRRIGGGDLRRPQGLKVAFGGPASRYQTDLPPLRRSR